MLVRLLCSLCKAFWQWRGQPDRVFRNAATAFAERWRCLKKVAGIYTCQIQVLRTFPLKTTFHSIFGYVDM